jgi:hypothetical protein
MGMGTTDPNACISWARCPISGAALETSFVRVAVFMMTSKNG